MSNIYQVNDIRKKISVLSDSALLIEFYTEENISDFSFKLGKKLKEKFLFIIDIVPTFSSVAIYFALDEDILHCKKLIEDFIDNQSNLTFNNGNDSIGVLHTIHVNYNGKDLQRVAEEKKLNNKELISIHSNKIYFVQFLGFIPGFAYLGTLDKRISLPRKKNPDKHVPKGSVAIAEDYTAIYPVNSPGGWNIIGHTEYEILNKKFSIKFKPGDKVKFVSI